MSRKRDIFSDKIEMITIGQYYSHTEDHRDTNVRYAGKQFVIKENYWGKETENEPHWAVTQEVSINAPSTESFLEQLSIEAMAMRVLIGLDYEVDGTIEENVIIWRKT